MIRHLATSAMILGASAMAAVAAPSTDLQFEAETCTLNLAPAYSAAPDGFLAVAVPEEGLIACPPGVTVPGGAGPFLLFSSASGAYGPGLFWSPRTYYDPSANAIVSDPSYVLGGLNSGFFDALLNSLTGVKRTPQGTFDQLRSVNVGLEIPAFIEDPNTALAYRVVLANPVQVVPTTAGAGECTVNLQGQYRWRWGQAAYWVIPDSAMQCVGFTYNSAAYTTWVQFDSRLQNQGVLYTASRDVYDPTSRTYTKRFELRLSNTGATPGATPRGDSGLPLGFGLAARQARIRRSHGIPFVPPAQPSGEGAATVASPVWGRFRLGTSQSPTIRRDGLVWANGTPGKQFMRVNVAPGSFAIKRATTVSLRARPAGTGKVRLSISADRNASFVNASTGPTYRRQTVLPSTPADHAVLKRGKKTIKRVRLSPYGTASVIVPDPPGRTPYSVTMVETNDNFVGSARTVR